MESTCTTSPRGRSRWLYEICVLVQRERVLGGAIWEVMVDRTDRVPVSKKGTDQWVQTERSVKFVTVLAFGKTQTTMSCGQALQEEGKRSLGRS